MTGQRSSLQLAHVVSQLDLDFLQTTVIKALSTSTPAPFRGLSQGYDTHKIAKLIVIVGTTGNHRGSVVDTFLTDKSWRIRAVTRNPSSPSAQEWAARGVELAHGDMDDISLTAAFTGVHAIFAMTDYRFPLGVPAVRVEAAKRSISPEERYAEIEIQRGTNLARVAASPGVLKTLHHYVYSSLTNHSGLSGGKYTQVVALR